MVDVGKLRKQMVSLEKGEDSSRREVIQALRQYVEQEWAEAPQDVVQSLIDSLLQQVHHNATAPFMQKEVATILGNMGPRSKSAVPQLVEFLQDGVPDPIREVAAAALGKIGRDAKAAVDRLVALAAGRNSLAIQAVRALGNIGHTDQRVRAALVDVWLGPMQSQNGQIQVAMALCKLRIDAQGLLPVLTGTLMSAQDVALRKMAAETLGWCNKNDPDVVPALLTTALDDKNEEVRQVAVAALQQMNLTTETAIPVCAKQLKEAQYAEIALRKSSALAVPALIKAFAADDREVRLKAARILACAGELAVAAAPALTTALRDKNAELRLAAAKALWNISKNADAVVPALILLLDEKPASDPADSEYARKFQLTVIEALWRIGPPAIGAQKALLEKAKDKNRLVSESAKNALKKIGAPETQKAAGAK